MPLIYKLDEETEFELEESEERVRSSGSTGVDSLAAHIDQVQSALAIVRDERVGKLKDELIEQCHEVIRKGGASADVYEAVFKTIEGPESEGMVKYEKAAKELQEQLQQVECKQSEPDLAKLYVEAVSVKESARSVMKNLCASKSFAQVETSSRKDSADDWGLEMGPLKKMRCVLQASESARLLSHHCLPCARLQSRM